MLDELLSCVYADRTAIGIIIAMGGTGGKMPDPDEARERLDKSLNDLGTGSKYNPEDTEWRRVMGLVN